jgi:hypothetical protein
VALPPVAPPPPPDPDRVADRFRREAPIYVDAQGSYHRATDVESGGTWLIRTHLFASRELAVKKGEQVERARASVGQLELRFFLPVITTEVSGSELRIVHPMIEGRPLPAVLAGPLAAVEARRLVRELIALFVASELAGLVHGNIRPAELILGDDHALYVSGVSMDAMPPGGEGPDLYRAPEVDRIGGSKRADQFAVAAICQELLRTFDHEAYLGSARVIAKAMAAEPDKRFETLADFARALDRELGAKARRRRH